MRNSCFREALKHEFAGSGGGNWNHMGEHCGQ